MGCDNRQPGASYRWLDKSSRLHMQHGPIDLIVQIEGTYPERKLAFEQAVTFFDSVLVDLVAELDQLRKPAAQLGALNVKGVVAKHMLQAVKPYQNEFVTPMASVAGSVADCTLASLCRDRNLTRACVNNGGDIALHLSANSSYTVGICESTTSHDRNANAVVEYSSTVRGIATSGWHGRSHSLGIADAVTVLASNAAAADTAATLIANAIDLPESVKIKRTPANELTPQSDLADRAVTVDVLPLTLTEKQQALTGGFQYAKNLVAKGLIESAYMSLQGQRVVAGHNPNIQWKQSA